MDYDQKEKKIKSRMEIEGVRKCLTIENNQYREKNKVALCRFSY